VPTAIRLRIGVGTPWGRTIYHRPLLPARLATLGGSGSSGVYFITGNGL